MSAAAPTSLLRDLDVERAGSEIHGFVRRAFPICRSITGDGVRETLEILRERLPLEIHEVPTGTSVLDWEVPREWNPREAWIEDARTGRRLVDFADHTLHLLGYSVPFEGELSREELEPHLHSLPAQPSLIPYRTSYYVDRWGFCLSQEHRDGLGEGPFRVRIDTSLEDGSLTYGELLLPGRSSREVLLSTHVCHPSLANDNLSGIGVLAALAERLGTLERAQRRYGYRFLFVPGTVGAIAWLARNPDCRERIAHGLVAANLGDGGGFHYKRSRSGAAVDRIVPRALATLGEALRVEDFVPFGYDERQYGSPGFDLPVGSLTRTPWGRYPEYHTSADDCDFVTPAALGGSLRAYLAVCAELEAQELYRNLAPEGEPRLGPRGLYRTLGGDESGRDRELALLWVLNQSDGEHSLQDIAERSGIGLARIREAAAALEEVQLLRPIER